MTSLVPSRLWNLSKIEQYGQSFPLRSQYRPRSRHGSLCSRIDQVVGASTHPVVSSGRATLSCARSNCASSDPYFWFIFRPDHHFGGCCYVLGLHHAANLWPARIAEQPGRSQPERFLAVASHPE